MKNVKIITIQSDFGAAKRGAKLGPKALLKAIEKNHPGFLEHCPVTSIESSDLVSNEIFETAKNIHNILSVQKRAIKAIDEVLSQGSFPFVISGDHSNGLAGISALKNQNPKWNIGVIWIDAHADLNTPFTSKTGNIHGMPLAAALALGPKANQKNKVDTDVVEKWDKLIALGQQRIKPKILPKNLVFIDIRDIDEEETNILFDNQIKYFTPQMRKEMGLKEIIRETLEHLADCNCLLVSFDVDSLDPTISYGTGTPVPDGLSKLEAIELLQAFLAEPKTKLFEISEINPLLDRYNPMEDVAAEIVVKALGY